MPATATLRGTPQLQFVALATPAHFQLPALRALHGALSDADFLVSIDVAPSRADQRAHALNLRHVVSLATTLAEQLAVSFTRPVMLPAEAVDLRMPPQSVRDYDARWSHPQLDNPSWSVAPWSTSAQRLRTIRSFGLSSQWEYVATRVSLGRAAPYAHNDPTPPLPRLVLPYLAVVKASLAAAQKFLPDPDATLPFHEDRAFAEEASALIGASSFLADRLFFHVEGGPTLAPDQVLDLLRAGSAKGGDFWRSLETTFSAALAAAPSEDAP